MFGKDKKSGRPPETEEPTEDDGDAAEGGEGTRNAEVTPKLSASACR